MTEAPESPPDTDSATTANTAASAAPSAAATVNTNFTAATQQQPTTLSSPVRGGEHKTNFGAPGSSYASKKFQDEYDKVESGLLDRGWQSAFFSSSSRGIGRQADVAGRSISGCAVPGLRDLERGRG